ncbi:3-carboxyethylcatechol 2,3-dioxygenase [Pusillimonas noertemannii]|uniref:2,3-dihydroxyphenylpropionate/2,3-dihydroxicinnamic acid 1,2-dioxygenase n=1 Tax=Pusillimonas noertemannii TaxID=305977 RepID=A0A2U1CNZ9_9BURK|nr:3-carboxyethylcatechol 2,3-dioxygenase [Pusillimonas noertemannii]NYT68253.1 3-carboxyethylcatechol 2,3-dioxygenase [Pusillimonas noertemannii]PVY62732.1 2,3-dihydroxyphenylpropionate 1,2-dioxygenase [Pusillimonas noertemannii]TFL10332.1 3-carboxyethylcatechol 2,3-dioxygenase [Pusillimonas noertemannii]
MSAMLLQCLSHTPLMGRLHPGQEIESEVEQALQRLRDSLARFEPDVIFLFGPDHFNGFFYDLMPSFCIGTAASSIGDYGCLKGPLDVPAGLAGECAQAVLDQGVDCAVSHRMRVDHGFAQPLQLLTGALDRYPVVPIFINSVAPPLPSAHRARLLGDAVGRFASSLDRRVVFMASGGLSHNPPVPSLATAPPEVAERLLDGRHVTPEQRGEREARTIEAARQFASGQSGLPPINPDWDHDFLDVLKRLDMAALDAFSNTEITARAGNSGHEVKTWIAANSAMSAATGGRYEVSPEYYRAIPEWIAGFATLQGATCR